MLVPVVIELNAIEIAIAFCNDAGIKTGWALLMKILSENNLAHLNAVETEVKKDDDFSKAGKMQNQFAFIAEGIFGFVITVTKEKKLQDTLLMKIALHFI